LKESYLSTNGRGEIFLRRVHGLALPQKERSREIRKALITEPLLSLIKGSPLRGFGHMSKKSVEAIPVGNTHGKAIQRLVKE